MAAYARNWCFTLNNPEDPAAPGSWDCRYVRWQLEEGDSGTPHLQGVIVFAAKRTFSTVKSLCPVAHWEVCRSLSHSIEYCGKEEGRISGPWEKGNRPSQGKRNDLLEIKQLIDSGGSFRQVRDQFYGQSIRYQKALQYDINMVASQKRKRRGRPEVLIIFGPSGVGKTRSVRRAFPTAFWLDRPEKYGRAWWDGYAGESTVVLDEFDGWLPYSFMKRLIDYGETKGETKGSKVQILANRIIFTSNVPPWCWYRKVKDPSRALERRLVDFAECLFIGSEWMWFSYMSWSQKWFLPLEIKDFVASYVLSRDINTSEL